MLVRQALYLWNCIPSPLLHRPNSVTNQLNTTSPSCADPQAKFSHLYFPTAVGLLPDSSKPDLLERVVCLQWPNRKYTKERGRSNRAKKELGNRKPGLPVICIDHNTIPKSHFFSSEVFGDWIGFFLDAQEPENLSLLPHWWDIDGPTFFILKVKGSGYSETSSAMGKRRRLRKRVKGRDGGREIETRDSEKRRLM